MAATWSVSNSDIAQPLSGVFWCGSGLKSHAVEVTDVDTFRAATIQEYTLLIPNLYQIMDTVGTFINFGNFKNKVFLKS